MPAARIFLQLSADFVVYLGLLIRPRSEPVINGLPCREILLSVELTAFKPAILESEPGLSLTLGGLRPDKFLPALKGRAAATSNHF
jgi:hypothetical protein